MIGDMGDITVLDVLELPILSNAQVRAGHKGLSNVIQYVNILDNRFDDTGTSAVLSNYGENFYITSMYYGKEDPSYILRVLQHFINVKASAVCITDEYVDRLPAEAYRLCDQNALPVIFVDKETPYSLIISGIMELKLSYHRSKQTELLLSELTHPGCSDEMIRRTLDQINPNFADRAVALHCVVPDAKKGRTSGVADQLKLISELNSRSQAFASEYRGGVMAIQTFSEGTKDASQMAEKWAAEIRSRLSSCVVGISNPHALMDLGKALSEAVTASRSGSYGKQGVIYFSQLGPVRLLMELQGKPALEQYYQELYLPLKQYDEKYRSSLLTTIDTFVENGMDYVKTGKVLFVHENTVRYRMNKVRTLIPYGISDMDFLQTLYLFYKIRKMKESGAALAESEPAGQNGTAGRKRNGQSKRPVKTEQPTENGTAALKAVEKR